MLARKRTVGHVQKTVPIPSAKPNFPAMTDTARCVSRIRETKPLVHIESTDALTENNRRFPQLTEDRTAPKITKFDPPTIRRQRTSLFRMQTGSMENARIQKQLKQEAELSSAEHENGAESMDSEENLLFERELYSDGTEQQCAFCDVHLIPMDMQEHMRAQHKDGAYDLPPRPGGTLLCPHPHCTVTVPDEQYLITHLAQYHNQESFRLMKQVFPNEAAFEQWRDTFEKEHDAKLYVGEMYTDERVTTTLMYCQYCDDWKQKVVYKSNTHKQVKLPCIGCPCHFNVDTDANTGFFTVVGCFSHLGHKKKLSTIITRKITGVPVIDGKFRCHECNLRFATKFAVTQHKKTEHETENVRGFKIQCADVKCQMMFDLMSNYVRHVRMDHDRQDIKVQTFEFENVQKFELWKNELESETCAAFVRTSGKLKSKTPKHGQPADASFHRYMACHRSGKKDTRGTMGHGSIRKRHSKKIGAYCTAFLNVFVSEPSGHVKVRGCVNHFGHEQEPESLPLPAALKDEIVGLLMAGMQPDKILEQIKRQSSSNSRGRCLKRYEVTNLAKKIVRDGDETGFLLVGDELMPVELKDIPHLYDNDADQIISADDTPLYSHPPKGFGRSAVFRRKNHHEMVHEIDSEHFIQTSDRMIGNLHDGDILPHETLIMRPGTSHEMLIQDDANYVVISSSQYDQLNEENEVLGEIMHIDHENPIEFEGEDSQQTEYEHAEEGFEQSTSANYETEAHCEMYTADTDYEEQPSEFHETEYEHEGEFVAQEFEPHPDEFVQYNEGEEHFEGEEQYGSQDEYVAPDGTEGTVYVADQQDGQFEDAQFIEQYQMVPEGTSLLSSTPYIVVDGQQYYPTTVRQSFAAGDDGVLVGPDNTRAVKEGPPLIRLPMHDADSYEDRNKLDVLLNKRKTVKSREEAAKLTETIRSLKSHIVKKQPQTLSVRIIEPKEPMVDEYQYGLPDYFDQDHQSSAYGSNVYDHENDLLDNIMNPLSDDYGLGI